MGAQPIKTRGSKKTSATYIGGDKSQELCIFFVQPFCPPPLRLSEKVSRISGSLQNRRLVNYPPKNYCTAAPATTKIGTPKRLKAANNGNCQPAKLASETKLAGNITEGTRETRRQSTKKAEKDNHQPEQIASNQKHKPVKTQKSAPRRDPHPSVYTTENGRRQPTKVLLTAYDV